MNKSRIIRAIYSISLLLLSCSFVIGQVSGRVIDSAGKAIPFCQVALVKAGDSTMVAMAVTDDLGKFAIKDVKNGKYRIMVAYIGYKKYCSQPFVIAGTASQYKTGDIILEAEAKNLEGVSIVAQKPFVEYQPDKTVYNIQNSVISTGNNMLEVLKRLPGVQLSNSNDITVNGQQGVVVMVDGRTIYLSAADLSNYLKSLNASQVEKVEVISPSAKNDAAGSMVINIVMKKDKKSGLSAELTSDYSQGIYYGLTEGININYNSPKWNVFANYAFADNKTIQYIDQATDFESQDIIQDTYKDTLVKKSTDITNNGMIMVYFMPDKKQTIGMVVQGNTTKEDFHKNYTTGIYGNNSRLDSSNILAGNRNMWTLNMSYDMNYALKLDTLGKELTASADYVDYSRAFNEQDVADYYDTLNAMTRQPTTLKFSLPDNVSIWAAKADYVQPLKKAGELEAGIKASYVSTTNNARYWNVQNGYDAIDTGFTNDFTYSEYIYAGYLSYTGKLSKKVGLQFGLRGEETMAKGIQAVHDTAFTHNYFNLFPNARISFKLDSGKTLYIRYRRRIWRPDYQSLNPFIYVINPYTYDQGNPALLPAISNSASIGVTYKQIFNIEGGDEYWTNLTTNVTTTNNNTHIIYTTPLNFKSFNNIFGRLDATFPVAKWFTSMNSFLLMQQQSQAAAEGIAFTVSQLVYTFSTVNTFTFGKNWSSEVDFNYNSKSLDGIFVVQPIYVLSAGVRRTFAQSRGSVNLNVSDIFWSNRYNETETLVNTSFTFSQYDDSRRFILSLSWKLGKSSEQKPHTENAAEEEINRM